MTKRPDAEATIRLNFYPQQQPGYKESEISAEDGTKLCCETHADSGAFTVLYQDTVGGKVTLIVYNCNVYVLKFMY